MDGNRRAFLSTGPSWLVWLVFIISTAVYLVLLYLSQPFSTNDEFAFEIFAGGLGLFAAGTIIIDTSCIWLKISERGHYYVQLLAGLVVVAASLALPWILPRPLYHHRWMFVAFSGFFLGFYTALWGWMRLSGLKR